MCLFCVCPGEPIEGDARNLRQDQFQVSMMEAPRADPLCCCISCLCPCCAQIHLRRKALHYDLSRYSCCQGYFDGFIPCFRSGSCGEASCPWCCLCAESFLCNGCAVSATRMMVMDRLNLRPDEWDNRIIRFNNCMQLSAIVCECVSICLPGMENCADLVQCIAQCTYACTEGCMTAQVNVELDTRDKELYQNMQNQVMERV